MNPLFVSLLPVNPLFRGFKAEPCRTDKLESQCAAWGPQERTAPCERGWLKKWIAGTFITKNNCGVMISKLVSPRQPFHCVSIAHIITLRPSNRYNKIYFKATRVISRTENASPEPPMNSWVFLLSGHRVWTNLVMCSEWTMWYHFWYQLSALMGLYSTVHRL